MIRRVTGRALTIAALFLVAVAVLLGSGGLFYMSTALIATIAASRLQAWLSVRGLRFERVAPESVTAGDLVTVEIIVWSEKRIRRPLVTVVDNLPPRLHAIDHTESLPIAPAFDQPIRTLYQFRPMRRGKYGWIGLTAYGTDALGLVTMAKRYDTTPAQMTVRPVPIPISLDLPHASSWGINEVESGRSRGAGIEPRGVRNYAAGDPLRHIHWRSSAKTGQLLVKEFEAGSHAPAAFILQRTSGTDVGVGPMSTFEAMCGHVAYICDRFLRQGVMVEFPTVEHRLKGISHKERQTEVLDVLASLNPDSAETLGDELLRGLPKLGSGAIVYLMAGVVDPSLPEAVRHASNAGVQAVVLAYDASAFLATPRKQVAPATDPLFLSNLDHAGAHVLVMPLEGLGVG